MSAEVITHPSFDKSDLVRHGFFTRNGGVSEGLFNSLNCGYGSGEDPATIGTNRARALQSINIPGLALVTARQQHTADAVYVDRPWRWDQAPVADGMVTDKPGIALGLLTADCAPVLMADLENQIIGVAHAGWRGAFDGIIGSTVDQMEKLGADRGEISAVIGPCIAQKSYEVGPEFHQRFIGDAVENERLFAPSERDNHHMFNLVAYVSGRLKETEVGRVGVIEADTCSESNRFFSYRRSVLVGEKGYGRGLSLIALAP